MQLHHSLFAVMSNLFHTGDSLSQETYPTLPDLCTGLEKWLNHLFPGKFSYGGRQLPIGQQDDGSSCGLCVMNAAEHKMLGAPLVTPDRSQHIRVQYFFDILTHVLRDVSRFFCSLLSASTQYPHSSPPSHVSFPDLPGGGTPSCPQRYVSASPSAFGLTFWMLV